MSGLHAAYPELKGSPKWATRALQAWSRPRVTSEGEPICEETVYASVERMLKKGWLEGAARIAFHYDSYLRMQDTRQLRTEDLDRADKTLAATFGQFNEARRSRPGRTKG